MNMQIVNGKNHQSKSGIIAKHNHQLCMCALQLIITVWRNYVSS